MKLLNYFMLILTIRCSAFSFNRHNTLFQRVPLRTIDFSIQESNIDDVSNNIENTPESKSEEEIRKDVLDQVEENMPSDLEIRLNLIGFTPFTIAGFGIALFVMLMNSILGAGWLADLLGMNMLQNKEISPAQNNYNNQIQTIRLNKPENLLR